MNKEPRRVAEIRRLLNPHASGAYLYHAVEDLLEFYRGAVERAEMLGQELAALRALKEEMPHVLAQLRHLYAQLLDGRVQGTEAARGLLNPLRALERASTKLDSLKGREGGDVGCACSCRH